MHIMLDLHYLYMYLVTVNMYIYLHFSVSLSVITLQMYINFIMYIPIYFISVYFDIYSSPPNRIWSHHNPVYSNNDSVFLQYIILSLRFCPSSIFWMHIKCIFKGLQQFVLIWQQLICQTFKWWLLTMVSEMYSSNTKSK